MTWIGGGLGNGDLKKEITAKMKMRNPAWPECLKEITNGWGASEYGKLLDGLCDRADDRNAFAYEIIDEEDRGMWIVIAKRGGTGAAAGDAR